ncbi:HepT-like ribonuclease domain-containing protein [Aromatoleum anaerobium]|uniref:DUF86 domain-containing protein n=1 Tax=Aromatoleum anaerobium TaxID=182180 RepID=A0ABX1PU60_9RHOO|nr:DUF86 domain-containing protein [Aromatoleum anaerobium]MCK0505416.1 DUF86 domain-containing protein [Aromatoleum anaerobium]
MKKKALRVPDYLSHILEAIRRIQRYAQGRSLDAFMADEQLQDAVVRNIEIIGEASRNIETYSPHFVAQHGEVPWAALYAMRNRVAHGYWAVDLAVVWQVVQRELPVLEAQIQTLLPADDLPTGEGLH